MTPAISVVSNSSKFGAFLYAPIPGRDHESPLSVLTALARLNVDPWEEAAKLSELPAVLAGQRLGSSIMRLPGKRWSQAESVAIADRLIMLLPQKSGSWPASSAIDDNARGNAGPTLAVLLLCVVVSLTAFIVASGRDAASRIDRPDLSVSSPSLPQAQP